MASKLPSKFGQVEDQTIKILNLSGLPVNCQLVPCDLLLYLFQFMDTWLEQTNTSLVNVQCSDGLSSCGFFCSAYNVVSNLKAGEDADVYLTCRVVQNNIPEAITQEQYSHLYQICEHYKREMTGSQLRRNSSFLMEARSSLESCSSTDND